LLQKISTISAHLYEGSKKLSGTKKSLNIVFKFLKVT